MKYAILPISDNYIIGSLTHRIAQHNRQEFPLLFSHLEKLVHQYGGNEFLTHDYSCDMDSPTEMNIYQYNRLICKILSV